MSLFATMMCLNTVIPHLTTANKTRAMQRFIDVVCNMKPLHQHPCVQHPLQLQSVKQLVLSYLGADDTLPFAIDKAIMVDSMLKNQSCEQKWIVPVCKQKRWRLTIPTISTAQFNKIADVVADTFHSVGDRLPLSIVKRISTAMTHLCQLLRGKSKSISMAMVELVEMLCDNVGNRKINKEHYRWFQRCLACIYVAFLCVPFIMELETTMTNESQKKVLRIIKCLKGLSKSFGFNCTHESARHAFRSLQVYLVILGMQTLDQLGKSFANVLKNPLGMVGAVDVGATDVGATDGKACGKVLQHCVATWTRHYIHLQHAIRIDFTTTNPQWWKARRHDGWSRVMAQLRHQHMQTCKDKQLLYMMVYCIVCYVTLVSLVGLI